MAQSIPSPHAGPTLSIPAWVDVEVVTAQRMVPFAAGLSGIDGADAHAPGVVDPMGHDIKMGLGYAATVEAVFPSGTDWDGQGVAQVVKLVADRHVASSKVPRVTIGAPRLALSLEETVAMAVEVAHPHCTGTEPRMGRNQRTVKVDHGPEQGGEVEYIPLVEEIGYVAGSSPPHVVHPAPAVRLEGAATAFNRTRLHIPMVPDSVTFPNVTPGEEAILLPDLTLLRVGVPQ